MGGVQGTSSSGVASDESAKCTEEGTLHFYSFISIEQVGNRDLGHLYMLMLLLLLLPPPLLPLLLFHVHKQIICFQY
jgi:hypothetical protein